MKLARIPFYPGTLVVAFVSLVLLVGMEGHTGRATDEWSSAIPAALALAAGLSYLMFRTRSKNGAAHENRADHAVEVLAVILLLFSAMINPPTSFLLALVLLLLLTAYNVLANRKGE